MTVTSSTSRVEYSGNGSTTVFAYPFRIRDEDTLKVILVSSSGVETTQTKTTHYTVSGVGDASGGSVTMLTAPASGESLVIQRDMPFTQSTDYTSGDPFPAETHEGALDDLVMNDQQQNSILDRAIKAPEQDASIGSLPIISDRSNKIFAFSAGGDPVATSYTDNDVQTLVNSYVSGSAITNASSVTYTPAGTGAVATNVQDRLRNYVSVKDFGAEGDGVTDDTDAFNAALLHCYNSGGLTLYVPAGYYLLTDQIQVGGPIVGDEGRIVSSAFWGDSQYSTNSNLGIGTVLVWDKSTLTTSSTHIIPISSTIDYVAFSGITFASKSSGSEGGGTLVTFRDGDHSDSFPIGNISNCRIANFAIGLNFEALSGIDVYNVWFRGCRKAVYCGPRSGAPSTVVTATNFVGCRFNGCGSSDSVYPFIDLERTQNIGFKNCIMQSTSDIRVTTISGTTHFDHCWFEDQSATDNLLIKAVAGGTLGVIVFDGCEAGAGTIGDIDLSASTNGGVLALINATMSGMSVTLHSDQYIFRVGSTDVATVTGGNANSVDSTQITWGKGDVSLNDGQLDVTTISTSSTTRQATFGSSSTTPKLHTGMQNGGAGNAFVAANYYNEGSDARDDNTKGTAVLKLSSGTSAQSVSVSLSNSSSSSPVDFFRVDHSTTAGDTRMLVWDVDNGVLERVTVGAANSGGSGYKLLRIPN